MLDMMLMYEKFYLPLPGNNFLYKLIYSQPSYGKDVHVYTCSSLLMSDAFVSIKYMYMYLYQ